MTTTLWILGFVAVAVTVLVFAVRTAKQEAPPKTPTFVCDRCGEHHCECHLKTDTEP